MAAISNCSSILTDPNGPYNLTASEAEDAFADFSLYTNAESCPMCASAIRWAGYVVRFLFFGLYITTCGLRAPSAAVSTPEWLESMAAYFAVASPSLGTAKHTLQYRGKMWQVY